jgi:hypothetical protein
MCSSPFRFRIDTWSTLAVWSQSADRSATSRYFCFPLVTLGIRDCNPHLGVITIHSPVSPSDLYPVPQVTRVSTDLVNDSERDAHIHRMVADFAYRPNTGIHDVWLIDSALFLELSFRQTHGIRGEAQNLKEAFSNAEQAYLCNNTNPALREFEWVR